MNEKNILFICEGQNDEPLFLEQLLKECYPTFKYKIYSYKTNIHILARFLRNEYPDFDQGDIDIALILRDLEKNPIEKEKLSIKFSDIILVFDIELQHPKVDFDIVKRMVNFFCDSTDMGKLYLNYPMMQSFKHLKKIPDIEYQNRKCSPFGYKELVDKESCINDLRKYSHITFAKIAIHNLMKLSKILYDEYQLPVTEDYISTDWEKLFEIEYDSYIKTGEIWVLNTVCLFLVDYNPTKFMYMVSKHSEKYSMLIYIKK